MKPDELDPLLSRLKQAQAAKAVPEPSGAFEQNVMREIRRTATVEQPWWVSLQPLVLRFAAASALAAVLMLAVGLNQGLSPSYEVAEVSLELEEETSMTALPEL